MHFLVTFIPGYSLLIDRHNSALLFPQTNKPKDWQIEYMYLKNIHNTEKTANISTSVKLQKNNATAIFWHTCTAQAACVVIQEHMPIFSRITWVRWNHKGKTSLDLNEAQDDGAFGWQMDHMQTICTSLQTDNHANTPSLNF